jgi:hypothetical protein
MIASVEDVATVAESAGAPVYPLRRRAILDLREALIRRFWPVIEDGGGIDIWAEPTGFTLEVWLPGAGRPFGINVDIHTDWNEEVVGGNSESQSDAAPETARHGPDDPAGLRDVLDILAGFQPRIDAGEVKVSLDVVSDDVRMSITHLESDGPDDAPESTDLVIELA